MTIEHIVVFTINAAVKRVDEPVAFTAGGMLKKCAGQNALAFRGEGQTDRIIHATGHYWLNAGAIRPRAEDVRGARGEFFSIRKCVGLFGEGAFAPVNPAIGPGVRAVQVVRAASECLALKPLDAHVGYAVA